MSSDRETATACFLSLAGDLDLVVGTDNGWLIYIENTGNSTAPVFVQDFSPESYSYSYLYDDDYVDDDDVATVPPSNASSYSYLYDDDYVDDDDVATVPPSSASSYSYLYADDYVDDNAARRRVTSSQSSYSNPFDGMYAGDYSAPAFGDLDNDGTLKPRPTIDGTSTTDKQRSHILCLSQATWTS